MGFWDKLTSKSKHPKGYVKTKVTFTAEEMEAMNNLLDLHATVANANAPEGQQFYVHPKVIEALRAQALTKYADDLVRRRMDECSSSAEIKEVLNMAVQAQIKAYALHNLPIYLYLAAMIFGIIGETARSTEFYQHFLNEHVTFRPDKIDTIFSDQMGYDMNKLVVSARQKLETVT